MLDQAFPQLVLPMTSGQQFDPAQLRGQAFVLYFYPKDNTPGCTTEGQDFRDLHAQFAASNCRIFGVSRDSLKSHESFKSAQCFPFELICDAEEALCNAFNVIKLKNMYGKQVRGIERSTFLIDAHGTVVHEWRGVKVPGHAQQVLERVQQLS